MTSFPKTGGFRMENATVVIITISFFHLPPTSGHFHPLQVKNCDSNSRLVVDEDDNRKGLKRLHDNIITYSSLYWSVY